MEKLTDGKQRENISKFYDTIEMPGGYNHDLQDVLKTIELYYNSRFKSGKWTSQGFRKFFFNIVKPACDVATKFIDLDTKDVVLVADNGADENRIWIMQKELKQWLKDENFGSILNKIGNDYPKYGHVFTKVIDGEVTVLNVANLRFDPASTSFDTDDFFYEIHRMTSAEIKSMKEWNQEAIEKLLDGDDGSRDVYEMYDLQEDGKWLRTFKADLHKASGKGAKKNATEAEINDGKDFVPAILLFEDEVKELPYRELKWDEVQGRRLGLGYVEYLFDNQIRQNEVTNMKSAGMYFTSLHLFTSPDDGIGRNVMTDMTNGDIIKTKQPLTPLANEERNLPAYREEEARWDSNTERKTFSFDVARGENLPSGTTLGSVNIQANMVISYFNLKRENFGIFVKNLLLDDIIPSFKKKTRKEHILTFNANDAEIDKLNKGIENYLLTDFSFKKAMATGFFPTFEQIELERLTLQEELKEKRGRYLKIPDAFYTNARFKMDILTTGEQVNSNSSVILSAVLPIASNPAIMQNKGTRKIVLKLLEMGGFNPLELDLINQASDDSPVVPEGQGVAPTASLGQAPLGIQGQTTSV